MQKLATEINELDRKLKRKQQEYEQKNKNTQTVWKLKEDAIKLEVYILYTKECDGLFDKVDHIREIYPNGESALRKMDEYKKDGYDIHCVKECLDMSHGLNQEYCYPYTVHINN